MQGTIRRSVGAREVEKLLANYSFNDRPIYFIQGDIGSNGKFKSTQTSTYQREEGSKAITLVPGPGNGLYPNYKDLKGKALRFEELGLTSHSNVTINWPEKRITKKSKPLAKIIKVRGIPEKLDDTSEDELSETDSSTEEKILEEVNISACGRFTSAHSLAKARGAQTYTVIGYGRREYRGRLATFVVTKSGDRIQCTKRLQALVEEEITHGIWFDVRIVRDIKINGYRDVECELV
jgi:hypothetical protein